jgi:hypothetical protein
MVTTIPETLRGFLLPFAQHFRTAASGSTRWPGASAAVSSAQRRSTRSGKYPGAGIHSILGILVARRRVHDVVAEQGYDLVHVHTPVAAFVTHLALRSLRRTGRRGRERMEDYDVHKSIALHEALYETALAARPADDNLAAGQTKR